LSCIEYQLDVCLLIVLTDIAIKKPTFNYYKKDSAAGLKKNI